MVEVNRPSVGVSGLTIAREIAPHATSQGKKMREEEVQRGKTRVKEEELWRYAE
jgi:hypothetical protein